MRPAFLEETVRTERSFIVVGATGPLLVNAMETEDLEQGAWAFAGSRRSIDLEHRDEMRDPPVKSSTRIPLYEISL